MLAFLNGNQASGPSTTNPGVPQTWAALSAAERQEYKDAGITVLVSLFGGNEMEPTTWNWDPTETANMMAEWVKANGVDGVDVDYEVGGSSFEL